MKRLILFALPVLMQTCTTEICLPPHSYPIFRGSRNKIIAADNVIMINRGRMEIFSIQNFNTNRNFSYIYTN